MASLRVTPKVEQAAPTAMVMPVRWPSMEICAAAMLSIFQMKLAETACQGGSGAPHFCCKRRRRRRFSFIAANLPDSTSPCTASDSISRNSSRYSASDAERSAQKLHQRSCANVALDFVDTVGAGRHFDAFELGRFAGLSPAAPRRVALRMGPEMIPMALCPVEVQALVVLGEEITEAGAHIDVGFGAESLQPPPQGRGSARGPG